MTNAIPEAVRPVWAEIDLAAVTANLTDLRAGLRPGTRLIAPVKADAYGHGAAEVARYLAALGVDGVATANVEDALAIRRAVPDLRILIYGAQLPDGNGTLLENGLTPSVYDRAGLAALSAHARNSDRPVPVHIKVDCGLGRLGVRLDEAAAFVGEVLATPTLWVEGLYTHIPFSAAADAAWSARRLAAFAAVAAEIQSRFDIAIPFVQAAASSVLAEGLPDPLNTVSPGHLLYGLSPLQHRDPDRLRLRPALHAIRARLIHIGARRPGDDLSGGPVKPGDSTSVGVALFGMDNGYRPAAQGATNVVLVRGRRCPVLSVSAEYSAIDLTAVPDATVGDVATFIGRDGDERIVTEEVAANQGAPSAAYWLVGLKRVPRRYSPPS